MSENIEASLIKGIEFSSKLKGFLDVWIDEDSKIEETIPRLMKEFKDKANLDREHAYSSSLKHFIMSKWSLYKTIYRFDPDFYDALINTEDSVFYQDNIRHLPVKCFFVPDPTGKFLGSIIYVELVGSDTEMSCNQLSYVEEELAQVSSTSILIHDKQTIYSAVEENLQAMKEWDSDVKKFSDEEIKSRAFNNLIPPIQIAYYLSAQNAEIKEVKTKKEKRLRRSDGKIVNIKQWDVGYRIGNKFREEQKSSTEHSERNGSSPRPHVRRAHWHHFWSGPNKSILIVKWLEPIFVNARSSDDLVSTEHKVLTK